MERIMILGCGGAGKSTMARQLGEVTGLPVVHLDRLFWRENWQPVEKSEFDALLAAELEKPRWIIDGNYSRTIPMRLSRCDTVIYLDYPRWQCLLGLLKRFLANFGKVRPDIGPGCKEKIDREFLTWIWNFKRKNGAKIYALLENADNVQVIVLKSRKEGQKFLETISKSTK